MNSREKTLRTATLLCVALCLSLAIAAFLWLGSSRLRIRVLDPEFHLRSARVLWTSKDHFYPGNELECRVRDFLRQRCHLNLKPVDGFFSYSPLSMQAPAMAIHLGSHHTLRQSGCTFALCYSLDTYPSAPLPLTAELFDPSGAYVPIAHTSAIETTNLCIQFFDLDGARTNAGNYKLKLKHGDVCVMEVELRDLPPVVHEPFHLGPNAF
jgi:hypothetical protein